MTDTPTRVDALPSAAGLVPPGETVRARLIVNAQAGLGLWPGAMPAAERLVAAGWRLDIIQTERERHATDLAREAVAQGYHIVVGCGGDGTLNEIVQAIAGTQVALGIIPTGTINVLAREFGIPLDPARAAQVLLTGRVQPMDVGRAGDRAFIMMAGVGLDADVVRDVQQAPRRPHRLLKGPLLFIGAVRGFVSHPGVPMTITLDGLVVRGRMMMVLISNIRLYGGVLQIANEAVVDDAILDVVAFHAVPLPARIAYFISVLLGRHKQQPGVSYHRARRVHIRTPRPVPIQADGDIIGATPMTFTSDPVALRVVLPGQQ